MIWNEQTNISSTYLDDGIRGMYTLNVQAFPQVNPLIDIAQEYSESRCEIRIHWELF